MPYSYGGVESFIDTLCRVDSKLGIENTVLTLHPEPRNHKIKMNGYSIHQAKQNFFFASTGISFEAFSKFRWLSDNADIIHYHFPNPFADVLHFVCRIKKPTLVTYHSDIIRYKKLFYLYRPLRNRFLEAVNHIVSTSPNYYISSTALQKFSDKVSVIPIGVDAADLAMSDPGRIAYWRRRMPERFFLFVGAFRYYKGLHIALDAVEGTGIYLALAGVGPTEKELTKKAEARNINNVMFLGSLSAEDKKALLHLCYGFIFPSFLRSEAFGISLLEAAAVGKPMISCEIGTGTSFVNISSETGIVITPGVPSELRDAMLFLLHNSDIAAAMGENARKRSLLLFSADKQAKSYHDLYTRLINRGLG